MGKLATGRPDGRYRISGSRTRFPATTTRLKVTMPLLLRIGPLLRRGSRRRLGGGRGGRRGGLLGGGRGGLRLHLGGGQARHVAQGAVVDLDVSLHFLDDAAAAGV